MPRSARPAPVLALTKTLSDGRRTATVTIELSAGQATTVARVDGREVGGTFGPRYQDDLPGGHVATVGALLLTAAEAATVTAAREAFQASLPRDLRAERDSLTDNLRAVAAGAADDRDAAWDSHDGGGNPFRGDAAAQARIAAAKASLDEFDAAHPEVGMAKRSALVESALRA